MGLLEDFRDTGPLDAQGEADTVARVLAGEGLVTYSILSRAALRMYKKESRTSPAHFDALRHLCAKLDDWGWDLLPPAGPLAAGGCRRATAASRHEAHPGPSSLQSGPPQA